MIYVSYLVFARYSFFGFSSLVLLLSGSKPHEIAPEGHTALHLPQRIHSPSLVSRVTLTSIGQTRSHSLQPTHLVLSNSMRYRLKRLKRE